MKANFIPLFLSDAKLTDLLMKIPSEILSV